ncbi:MAG TPA: hypothetical protein VE269_01900, partial [Gaiellaceae bacterium]|nr:hypothetical protein [Gaiellaceae bacterium]
HEGIRRIDALAADPDRLPPELRARALRIRGGLRYIVGNFEEGVRLAEQATEAFRALGDELAVAHMLQRLAVEATRTGDAERASELAAENLLMNRDVESPSGEALALGILASVEAGAGRPEEAIELATRAASEAGAVRFTWFQVHALYQVAELSAELGRMEDVERTGLEALRLADQIGDRQMRVYLLALLARAATNTGSGERAGVLWGAVEGEEARAPVGQWEDERDAYAAPVLAHADEHFERGRKQGRELSLSEAVAYACSPAAG